MDGREGFQEMGLETLVAVMSPQFAPWQQALAEQPTGPPVGRATGRHGRFWSPAAIRSRPTHALYFSASCGATDSIRQRCRSSVRA